MTPLETELLSAVLFFRSLSSSFLRRKNQNLIIAQELTPEPATLASDLLLYYFATEIINYYSLWYNIIWSQRPAGAMLHDTDTQCSFNFFILNFELITLGQKSGIS